MQNLGSFNLEAFIFNLIKSILLSNIIDKNYCNKKIYIYVFYLFNYQVYKLLKNFQCLYLKFYHYFFL